MSKPYNYHNHTREDVDLVIESWGGEYIQLYYLADEVAIMLMIDEIDPLIEALKEAKEAQSKPGRQYEETQKMIAWNQSVLRTYKPEATNETN